jgi:hypothetical protein
MAWGRAGRLALILLGLGLSGPGAVPPLGPDVTRARQLPWQPTWPRAQARGLRRALLHLVAALPQPAAGNTPEHWHLWAELSRRLRPPYPDPVSACGLLLGGPGGIPAARAPGLPARPGGAGPDLLRCVCAHGPGRLRSRAALRPRDGDLDDLAALRGLGPTRPLPRGCAGRKPPRPGRPAPTVSSSASSCFSWPLCARATVLPGSAAGRPGRGRRYKGPGRALLRRGSRTAVPAPRPARRRTPPSALSMPHLPAGPGPRPLARRPHGRRRPFFPVPKLLAIYESSAPEYLKPKQMG